jgi:hypothetical protein
MSFIFINCAVLFDRIDLKMNLIHLLCLCNYSFNNPQCSVQLKIKKVLLTKSIDFKKKALVDSNQGGIMCNQTIFHDLESISIDMPFNMKQFPNVLPRIKKCIKQKKLLYLKSESLEFFKQEHDINNFELTIFYYFEKHSKENTDVSMVKPTSKIHNVFIIGSNQPVLLLFNPFQHSFIE